MPSGSRRSGRAKLSVGQIIAAGARGLRIKQVARVGFSLARLCRLVQIRC